MEDKEEGTRNGNILIFQTLFFFYCILVHFFFVIILGVLEILIEINLWIFMEGYFVCVCVLNKFLYQKFSMQLHSTLAFVVVAFVHMKD